MRRNDRLQRLKRLAVGLALILLSLPSFLFPILPGWLLLALGILLLSMDIPIFNRMVRWVERRFPPTRRPLARLRRFLGVPDGLG
jgi:hypothetical protein